MRLLLIFSWIILIGFFAQEGMSQRSVANLEAQLDSVQGVSRAFLLNELAARYKLENAARSLEYSLKALEMAKSLDLPEQVHVAYNNLGEYYLDQGMYDSALYFFEEGYHYESLNITDQQRMIAYSKIGVTYYFKNRYNEALDYLFKAAEMAELLDDTLEIAKIYNSISYSYEKKGWYERALEYRLKSLKSRQMLGEPNELSKSYNSLGDFYFNQGNYYQALRYYTQSYETGVTIKNKKGIAISLHNIALVYNKLGDYSQALVRHNEALGIKQMIGNKKEIALSLNNIGDVFIALKSYDSAYQYLSKAALLNKEISNASGLIESYLLMAKYWGHQARFDSALVAQKKALQYAKEANTPPLLIRCYRELANTYRKMGNASAFLDATNSYVALEDSIPSNLNANDITSIQQEYEEEKNLQQFEVMKRERIIQDLELKNANSKLLITLTAAIGSALLLIVIFLLYQLKMRSNRQLKIHNREISAQNTKLKELNEALEQSKAELDQSNRAKEKLLTVISHDVRSPINSLRGIISLLRDQWPSGTEETQILNKLEQKITILQEFLDNLLRWAKIQSNSLVFQPEKFLLCTEIDKILTIYQSQLAEKELKAQHNIPADLYLFGDRNMIECIMRNLIANAIKFSFLGRTIYLSAKIENQTAEILVKDEGVGMSEEEIDLILHPEQLVSKAGTAAEQGTGLGLVISREFAEKHGGRIQVQSKKGLGSTFSLILPI